MKIAWGVSLLVLCCSANAQAQKNQCDCEVFLSTQFTGEKRVYLQPNNKTELYAVSNNPLDEDFIHFTVVAQRGEWLQVAPYGIKKWFDTGWVEHTSMAVYGRSYNSPVNIYKKADTTSAVVTILPAGYEPEYRVTGCNNK